MKTITLKMCKVRQDLVNEGISIPVGKNTYRIWRIPISLVEQ